MNLPIIVQFKSSGSPQTGLTPTVTVRQIDQNNGTDTTVVNAQNMTEVGDGLYLYNFSTFNILYNYVATFDAGAASDDRYPAADYSGVQALIDAIPRGGGGGGSVIGITTKDFEKLSKQLEDQITTLFGSFTLEIDQTDLKESKKELDSAITEFKKQAQKEQDRILKLLDKEFKRISAPVIENRHETVDISRFKSEMAQTINKQLKIEQGALDELLSDAVLLFRKEIKENNEKYRDIIRAEEEAKLVEEFKQKLRS